MYIISQCICTYTSTGQARVTRIQTCAVYLCVFVACECLSLPLSMCMYMYAKATVSYWLVLMWLSMCRGGRAAHKHIHWAALAVESVETSSHRPVWWPQTGCFTVFQYVWHTALIYFNLLHCHCCTLLIVIVYGLVWSHVRAKRARCC